MRDCDTEKKLYFNKFEFNKIQELSKKDPLLAIELYKDYLIKYPSDYSARTYFASLLIAVGQFNKAEEVLNNLEAIICKNPSYAKDEKVDILKHNLKLSWLKLLLYSDRKKELLDYYYQNREEFDYLGGEVTFYFRKLAGKTSNCVREFNAYMFRQIIEYREEDFKDHIKKHLADFNENDRSISVSYFSCDFPVDQIIEEVKKYIPSDKKLCLGFIENTYVFKYDECGRDKNRLVDYFKVITFNNNCDFITMCPSQDCECLPFIDLNYLKEKEDKDVKVKRLSQIDKFNRRYGQSR